MRLDKFFVEFYDGDSYYEGLIIHAETDQVVGCVLTAGLTTGFLTKFQDPLNQVITD